jgi:hypothetical protein
LHFYEANKRFGKIKEMHCHIIHMDMLNLSFPPTLVISLPEMNYRLAEHITQSITAESGHGKLHNNLYKTMTGLKITYYS